MNSDSKLYRCNAMQKGMGRTPVYRLDRDNKRYGGSRYITSIQRKLFKEGPRRIRVIIIAILDLYINGIKKYAPGGRSNLYLDLSIVRRQILRNNPPDPLSTTQYSFPRDRVSSKAGFPFPFATFESLSLGLC